MKLARGLIGRVLRGTLFVCCVIAWVGIAVGWGVSSREPFSVARRGPSRPDGAGHYIASAQRFYAAGGGVHLSLENTTTTKVHEPFFIVSSGAENLSRSYPPVYPANPVKGTVLSAGGFAAWSTHNGRAYLYGTDPILHLAETGPNPAASGGTLIWVSRDERSVVAPFWFLLLLATPYPLARLGVARRRAAAAVPGRSEPPPGNLSAARAGPRNRGFGRFSV